MDPSDIRVMVPRNMSARSQSSLLAALMVAAQCDGEPVTYLILTLRLHDFGGDRVCRGLIDKMKRSGYLVIDPSAAGSDRRTKAVRITRDGWSALKNYADLVNEVVSTHGFTGAPRSIAASPRPI